MSGKLFVVGTPIGNLNDLSPRGLEVLSNCDFIAAEDTRVTLKLLNRFDIKKPMISYFEHNKFERGPVIIDRILSGESCALVTDAGMPAISDPGEDLVKLCHEYNITIESVPGPCAFATALAISGMPSRRFCFEGFPPTDKQSRKALFDELKNDERTIIFYEAPHKFKNTIKDIYEQFGNRKIAIVRELTKIHEEVIHTSLEDANEKYSKEEIRGEIVLIIHGCEKKENTEMSFEDTIKYALQLVESGESKTNAAKSAAKISGFKKNDIYREITQ